jgi:hypothetical protein
MLNTKRIMGKHKPKRPYRLIGFKAYIDGDQAIIDWWDSLDDGSRSTAIRDLLHEALGLKPQRRKTYELPELAELQQNTRWIRQTLNDMPSYLEELVTHLQPAAVVPIAKTSDLSVLNDAESQRRARKLKRVSW